MVVWVYTSWGGFGSNFWRILCLRWQQVGVSVWVNSINVDRIISIHPDPKPFRQRVSRTPHPNCWCSKLTCMLIDTCRHSRVWSIGQRQIQLFSDIYFAASINSNCIYFANCRIISWHSVNSQSNSVISCDFAARWKIPKEKCTDVAN